MKVFNRDVYLAGKDLRSIGTATASSGAATLNAVTGTVTSESLTTAQNAIYTLTLTNNKISADSVVLVSVANGSNTQGTPQLGIVTPSAGSVVIRVINKHATSEAFNGTIKVNFTVINNRD
jgi:hypothetical protein